MAQWYCHAGGKQYGPISDEVLGQWIAEGRVKPTDLVWSEGMDQWAPAGVAVGHMFAGLPPYSTPPPLSMVAAPPPGGTGGATPNAEIMSQARELLRGRWGLPIAFSLLLALLGAAAGMVPYVGQIASSILAGPFQLGGVIFYVTFVRGGQHELGMLFAGFRNFGKALGAYLLMTLFIILWALLLIIPGIIAALRYSQTFYLLADNPSLGPLEAISKSKEMMRGYKWKLFCLSLRFIGWALLCILTLGIGLLWLNPYMSASYARFYDDLRPPAAGQVGPPSNGLVGSAAATL